MFFLSFVCHAFVRVCLFVSCGHLLGKGWPLCSRLWCLTVCLSLSHWYPGSGVVLDCIDSWSLHLYFLWHCFLKSIEATVRSKIVNLLFVYLFIVSLIIGWGFVFSLQCVIVAFPGHAHLFLKYYLSRDVCFPTMWHFDKCRLRLACAASF